MDNTNIKKLFDSPLVCVNVGPALMGQALEKQGVEVVQVDWKPTAGGDKKMQSLLDLLGGI